MIITPAKRIKDAGELDRESVCYWRTEQGWLLYLPKCGTGCLAGAEVTVHHDGTISVYPDVWMQGEDHGEPTERQGFLINGYWREIQLVAECPQ